MENESTYKWNLFAECEAYYQEAQEWYAVGNRERAEENEETFRALFEKIRILGWDKEFMGIA
ncbi:MAG: hypothetical protein IJI57_04990 [Flexilinea sp.]|nr:hypothetical protein [Flexilinea sp.]